MMAYLKFQQSSIVTVAIIFILNLNIVYVLSSPVPSFLFQQEVNFDKSNDKQITKAFGFPDDERKDVRKCLDDDYSMPFFDIPSGQFICHKLLTQGPCESDEWFVLSDEFSVTNSDLPHGICKTRECHPDLSGTNGIQEMVMFNGKCTNVTSSDECDEANMVVLINPLGEGECNCKDKFMEWCPTDSSQGKQCYQEYLQGPCKAGYQLVPKEDVELTVSVNKRPLQIPVFLNGTQIIIKDDDTDLSGSICIPSDCEKEGFVRLKTGECVKPKSCLKNEILVSSTQFASNTNGTEIKFQQENGALTTCCLSDDELVHRTKIVSQLKGTKLEEELKKNACLDLGRSALVTIPESCPRGQTITHDGECKHVRIWRSRPRRHSNRNNRIRQMMRYVRALRRRNFFNTCEIIA